MGINFVLTKASTDQCFPPNHYYHHHHHCQQQQRHRHHHPHIVNYQKRITLSVKIDEQQGIELKSMNRLSFLVHFS